MIDLNGPWSMCICDAAQTHPCWMPCEVPGSVYSCLLALGRIPDPYDQDNELAVLPLMEHDFAFLREFEISREQLQAPVAQLCFEGIDTLAEISLNGRVLGIADNMHRTWRFDALSALQEGLNRLVVHIYSPTQYIAEKDAHIHAGGITDAMVGFPHIRKAHCMFGWDWGPRLPDAGIFRSVTLTIGSGIRIADVLIHQEHIRENNGLQVKVTFTPHVLGMRASDHLGCMLQAADGTTYVGEDMTVTIPRPELWWPNGYGEQPLYWATVVLRDANGLQLACWRRRIGLRTLDVCTDADAYGKRFAQRVNGVEVFAMGANYIPEDNLLSRITPERTRRLLSMAHDAHHNTIRVWGGGYYPDDFFYDACDELGLMVWQDAMFSCAAYELDDAFEENVLCELRDNARRIRHHACLCLWCGNNEVEMQIADNTWGVSEKQRYDYIRLFEHSIPKLMARECPDVFFWPSSPSSGGNYERTCAEDEGDSHYWDVWHGGKPFSAFREHFCRYLSEFGFQSFPCLNTIRTFTRPEDRNIFSRVMEMHQRNAAANGKILGYLAQYYLYPGCFEHVVYASQLLQAVSIRYGIEHFRRHRGQCMGTLVWQLNDIWPAASWAGIDYFGRPKALHYIEKRAFAPVMISCEEMGELNQRPFCVSQPYPIEKSIRLHVANETCAPVSGEVRWELRDPMSNILQSDARAVTVPPLSGLWLKKVAFPDIDERSAYVSYGFVANGQTVSQGSVLFTMPKYFRFLDPHLTCTVEADTVLVSADAYAQCVEVTNQDGTLVLEDNVFDMNGGEWRVKVCSGTMENIRVRSVYDIAKQSSHINETRGNE